jgi:Predicted aminopeptidases
MRKLTALLVLCLMAIGLYAQNYTNPFYWNLMDGKTYDYILGEASGDLAYYHVLNHAAYEVDRTNAQYASNFHETDYVLNKLKEYGLQGVAVERFGKNSVWDGISASLWEITPKISKIADYLDLAAVLGQGSKNADVKAELVWIGRGTKAEIDAAGVAGKIVVTEGAPGRVHDLAIDAGALGVISFNTPRPLVDPLQVPNTGIRGDKATFLFNLPPRDGYPLRDRLLAGEKIVVHAKVKTQQIDAELQVPTCIIQGTDSNAEEVIVIGHIFEGFVKLGANDNASGVATLLEIARTLNTLINNGSIERPKRTIRFLWVPEFSGSGPWVQAHKDIAARTLCAVNLDMVGLWLSKSESYYNLQRTTMANPHYVNDVAESFFHYMSITNKSFTATGMGRPEPIKPAFSLTGSHDPFYYSINGHYGASDHEVFNDWGVQVPSIIMITWPDNYYHTSGDRPSILDPTQLKRATILAGATAYFIASASDESAVKIVGEVSSNSVKRMALYQARGSAYINAATKENLLDVYKKAIWDIDALQINEAETMNSIKELAPGNAALNTHIADQIKSHALNCDNARKAVEGIMRIKAAALGVTVPKTPLVLTAEELAASKVFPKSTAKVLETGYGVTRLISRELQQKYQAAVANSGEVAKLTTAGVHSILDIKKMMEAQFPQKIEIAELTKYMNMLKEAGLVTF